MPEAAPENPLETAFTRQLGIERPIICGAMYPCSNPELVAAASAAGGIGIIQPISMSYVHGHELNEGIRRIRAVTERPFGINILVEKTVRAFEQRMRRWLHTALDGGARLVVTALGNPGWVVEAAHSAGALVYHDVTSRKWALKAMEAGVDGLICVNSRAGGHAGDREPEALRSELADLRVPLVCAGGIGHEVGFSEALAAGYAGVQMGTRFIATSECHAHPDYKQAILRARATDIVLTDKLSGVPCAIIRTPTVARMGTKAGPIARYLLRGRKTKHLMRTLYNLRSLWNLKRSLFSGDAYRDWYQAGKSVEHIDRVEPVATILDRFAEHAQRQHTGSPPG